VKKRRGEEGFTLIELMVVILIIGILVAIAVPVYFSAQESAKTKTCQANVRTMNGAIMTYQAATGNTPADLNALVPDYIKEVPTCPLGGTYSLDPATATEPAECLCNHT
jgi:type IV pilus assembly protein PilA